MDDSGPLPGGSPPALVRPRWSRVAAVGAAALLVLVAFFARAGSPVAVIVVLALAAALALVALVAWMRERRARPRFRAPLLGRTRPAPPRPSSQSGRRIEAAGAGDRPTPRPTGTGTTASPDSGRGPYDVVRSAGAFEPPPGVSREAARVAHRLAEAAVRRLATPAAAVLVPLGRRLTAAGVAGDWALARQLQAETDAAASRGAADAEPPDFPLDETMTQLLAMYAKAVAVERWQELWDAPGALLPLAALADRGVGVAVPIAHQGRLVGLCVVARRPAARHFTGAEAAALERLAREVAPALATAQAPL